MYILVCIARKQCITLDSTSIIHISTTSSDSTQFDIETLLLFSFINGIYIYGISSSTQLSLP